MPKTDSYIYLRGWKINIYTIGIIFWIALWTLISIVTIFRYSWNWWYLSYLLPIIAGVCILKSNYYIWMKEIEIEEYPDEVKLIEFVERNANYVILGITALFIASELIFNGKSVDLRGFYSFQLMSLVFSIGFVLPLIWKPRKEDNIIPLVLLRHWKTVWHTFSIYLFLAAVIALVLTLQGIK